MWENNGGSGNGWNNGNNGGSRNGWNGGNNGNGWLTNAGDAFVPKDAALHTTLTRTFLFMAIALLITGATAMIAVMSKSFVSLFYGSYAPFIICAVVEMILVFACQRAMIKNNITVAGALFAAFAVVNGLTFSSIFIIFEASSIGMIFLLTAGIFAALAVVGITTKRDISRLGPILRVGIIALLIGSVINIFIGASGIDFILTIAGIVIFTLFTVYDINKVVRIMNMSSGLSMNALALYGALQLYLDFINLFIRFLRLFGKRRN